MSCRAELRGLGAVDEAIREAGGRLLAISVDPPDVSRGLAAKLGLAFPIASDVERHVVQAYGLLHARGSPAYADIAIPAHFLVDRDGRIRWRHLARRIQDRPVLARIVEEIAALRG